MLKPIAYTVLMLTVLSQGLFSCTDPTALLREPINCQLAQATFKTSTGSPAGYPALTPDEHVSLDEQNSGSPLPEGLPNGDFYNAGNTHYTFNDKGQLTEQVTANRDYIQSYLWRDQYDYTDRALTLRKDTFWDGKQVASATGYFTLNDKGQITTGLIYGSRRTYTYDTEGNLIRLVQIDASGETQQKDLVYENGNVVKVVASGPDYEQTIIYDYDLARARLPTFGYDLAYEMGLDTDHTSQRSRNLLLKKTDFRTYKKPGTLTSQRLTTTVYTYTFDARNRVKRRLTVQALRSSWLAYPTQISTSASANLVDLDYNCPAGY